MGFVLGYRGELYVTYGNRVWDLAYMRHAQLFQTSSHRIY